MIFFPYTTLFRSQKLLTYPNEGDDRKTIPQGEQARLLGGHISAELHQGHRHNQNTCRSIQQQVGDRSSGKDRVFEKLTIHKGVGGFHLNTDEEDTTDNS